jgi:hypothetical protein
VREDDWLIYPQHAAASLWSTPTDLARFLAALISIYRSAPAALLKSVAARETQKHIDSIMGLALDTEHFVEDDRKLVSHAGWNTGYRSFIAAIPEAGDGIAVMTNADHGGDLAMEIVRRAARVYGWPAFAPVPMTAATLGNEVFAAITGTYDFPEAEIQLVVSRDRDRLRATAPRGYSILQPVGHDWPRSVTLYGIEDAGVATIQQNKGQLELLMRGMTGRRVGG